MICVDTQTDGNKFLQIFDNSKEVLASRAEQMIQAFGYTDPPVDRFSAFGVRNDFAQYGLDKLKPVEYRDLAAKRQPALDTRPVAFDIRPMPVYT